MKAAALRRLVGLVALALLCASASVQALGTARKIVLIGGTKSEGPARHDYPNGIRLLKAFLESASVNARVVSFEDGWPDDPAAFDGASAIVFYFDGLDRHPLRDAGQRRQFEMAMRRGVGLVALHQASTVSFDDEAIGLRRWLGVERRGAFDRTTEWATIEPAAVGHPVSRGIAAFTYRDEFYPTLRQAESGRLTAILTASLHVQMREGRSVLADVAEATTVAWAFERPGGGRSFAFSGGHFLAVLDEPMLKKTLLNAILWSAGIAVPRHGARTMPSGAATQIARSAERAAPSGVPRLGAADTTTFHHDAQRTGWHAEHRVLTPANVAGPTFGRLWESPPLGTAEGLPARLYASPLYLDRLAISDGPQRGETFSVVFAATNLGDVFAINAERAGDLAPGRILWHRHLADACRLQPAPLDAVPTGILATPVIDVARGRLYVTHCDPAQRWQAYALDVGSGQVLPGWPVRLDEARLNVVNRNVGPAPVAPTRRFDFRVQRGALNLSPDGERLYISFGETETGWLVSVNTRTAEVDSAFATVAMPHRGSGGLWGAGGPAVDSAGHVFVVTGTGFSGYIDQPGDWTQSVLKLSDREPQGLRLEGSYTPFNHCVTANSDIDLGSGGASLLPELDPRSTTTPALMVVGGKQGNAYLLDREHLPGRLDRRPSCSDDAASDASLLAPQRRPPFPGRAPLNVFGPYSERNAALDAARARSVPAIFRDTSGRAWVYLTGTSRSGEQATNGAAPSLARLAVVVRSGEPAYLEIDRVQGDVVFQNPGSPVVSSGASADAIVWVLDENAPRSAALAGAEAPAPVLYGFDAATLHLLWRSAQGELHTSGKYNEPAFSRDAVLVGTDRIQAFGPSGERTAEPFQERAGRQPASAAAAAPAAETARSATTRGLADGETLYRQRCAMCHDDPRGSIPPRQWLASLPRAAIVDALARGAMRAQAAGLSAGDIDAIAEALK